MKISELVVGEFYIIKPTTRKQVVVRDNNLKLASFTPVLEENKVYKESLYVYVGQRTERVEKRLDSKITNVYTYKPHMMHCVKTGETFKVTSYYVQTYFIKPEKQEGAMEADGLFGRPWKVAGRFDTFEAADRKRKQLSSEKNLQVKVKKQLKGFVVKTRSTVVQPQVEERRSRKKQRKEKMNER